MSFFFKSLLGGAIGYSIWGILAKISFLLCCVGIVLLILRSRRGNIVCKDCGQPTSSNGEYCYKCGIYLTEDKAGTDKKGKRVCAIFTASMFCLFAFSTIAVSKNTTVGNMATGIYSGYNQLYMQNDKMWNIECDKALTEGSFNHVVLANDIPSEMVVEASCDNGTMILNMTQGEKIESYNITNTNGGQVIDLSWLESDTQAKLSVEHTVASGIVFLISWK